MKKLFFDYYDWAEFQRFLDSLPSKDAVKLTKLISKIEIYGLAVAQCQEWTKKLEDNLFEIRSQFGSNIQRAIYFHVSRNQYLITHGFTKKRNKTPESEKKRGRGRRNTYFHERRNDDEQN